MKNIKVSIALFLGIGFTVASLVAIGVAGVANIDCLNEGYSVMAASENIF